MADPVPGTLGYMKARIARELGRSNLSQQIADAIADAIKTYSSERFRFSETTPGAPPTFNTVAGRFVYTSADNANISTLYNFDYVLMNVGNTVTELERWQPKVIKLYIQQNTMVGQPMWYAYEGNEMIIAAIPDQAYLITLGAFLNVAAPPDDATPNNPWMNDAEMLIRSRAKYEIAKHVTRNKDMEQRMSPMPADQNGGITGASYDAWSNLKGAVNRVTGRARIRPMAF